MPIEDRRRFFKYSAAIAAAEFLRAIPLAAASAATPAGSRGTRAFRWLEVAKLSSGTALRLPLHDIRGVRAGPTLAITAAVHGWEILGIEVIRRLLNEVGANFAGRILSVPVANPPAFQTQTRHSPLDSEDLNRVFPGDQNGWISARIAEHLVREVIAPADFYVDIHGGDHSCTVNYAMGSTRELALLSGFPIVRVLGDVFSGAGNLTGTAIGHAMSLGKPVFGLEVGAGYQADELCIDTALCSLRNAMHSLGMLQGEPKIPATQWIIKKTRVLRVDHGGLFLPGLAADQLNQPVGGGTILGQVVDPFTLESLQTLTAPWPRGILMMHKAGIAMVEAGLWVFNVGDLDSAERVDHD